MLLCLASCLSACATRTVVKTLVAVPPADLMRDCPEREVRITVNRDMVTKIETLRGDLGRCNVDKRSLRAWAKEATKDNAN